MMPDTRPTHRRRAELVRRFPSLEALERRRSASDTNQGLRFGVGVEAIGLVAAIASAEVERLRFHGDETLDRPQPGGSWRSSQPIDQPAADLTAVAATPARRRPETSSEIGAQTARNHMGPTPTSTATLLRIGTDRLRPRPGFDSGTTTPVGPGSTGSGLFRMRSGASPALAPRTWRDIAPAVGGTSVLPEIDPAAIGPGSAGDLRRTQASTSEFGPVVGGGTEPTVRIASPGKHAGDAGDAPEVIQGMSYKGLLVFGQTQQTTTGPTITWNADTITWTYPAAAIKGYGVFSTIEPDDLEGDPDGDYTRFVAQPTNVSGNKVEWQGFTGDDMQRDNTQKGAAGTPRAGQVVDHFIDTFYWGPVAEGAQTVSVSVVFRKYLDGQATDETVTKGDSVTLDVLKPTGTMSLISIGDPGVTPPQQFGPQYLSMAQNTPRDPEGHASGTPLGIRYSSSVTAPGGFGGVFMHNQTMTTSEQRTYQDATGAHHEVRGKYNGQPYDLSSNFVLDTRVGYLGRVDDPNVGPGASPNVSSAPVGHTFYSNDSPSSPLIPPSGTTGIAWFRVDSFSITLMYNPLTTDPNAPPAGPPNSIWVPVGVLTWYWGAYAAFSNANGIWNDDPDNPPDSGTFGNYQPSALYPTWSVNIDDANGNNDKSTSPWVPLP